MSETGASFGGRKRFEGPGGTPGGLGEFFIGLTLAGIGVYLLFERITVQTSFWHFASGTSTVGPTLLLLVIGVALLFWNARSILGWLLTIGGLVFLVVGVIANMDVYFQRTSLWGTLIMLGLLGAGLGLMAKSFRVHR